MNESIEEARTGKPPCAPVTVVIPAHKAARTIARAVDSVLRQTGCAARVIVVVDGPCDETERLLKGYGSPVRTLVNDRNRGVQFSRNAGLALVRDGWVMFLDADDFIEGPLLGGLIAAMSQADADVGFAPMQVLDERYGRRGRVRSLEGSDEEIFVDWLGRGRFVGCCSVLWRTDYLRRIGGWDDDLNRQEDGEMVLRALLLGARTARSAAGRGIYVMHDSPDRLTRRSDNLASLLQVPAKLLSLPDARFDGAVRQRACAMSYYNAARTCYVRGQADLGRIALERSRALGFRGHRGPTPWRLLSTFLGLRASAGVEAALRRLVGRSV